MVAVKLSFLNFIPFGCKKPVLWVVGVLLFYTAFGFFILPSLVRVVVVRQLSKYLDRQVTIRTVRLNPFMLSGSVRGLLIKDKDGAALVSWDEAYVNFQLASLFTHSWVLDELSLSQPFLHVQVNRDFSLNLSEMLSRLSPSKSGQAGEFRPWRVHRLRLIGAKVSFTDLTTRKPFQRTVGPLRMTLTDFRTDSKHKNVFALSGLSDGGEQFSWNGSFYLEPLRSEGEVSLAGFALTTYSRLYQDLFRFEIKDGVIGLHSTYHYERSATINLLAFTNTTFELKSLEMVEKKTGRAAVEVSNFVVTGASVDAMARQAEADTFTMTGGRFVLRRNKDTSVNAIELLKPADSAPPMPGGVLLLLRGMTNLLTLLLDTTNLANGTIRNLNFTNCALHLEDLANSKPVRLDLEDIAIRAKNISNRSGTNLTAEISSRWDTNGTLRADIKGALSPGNAEVALKLDQLNLAPLAPYLEPYLDIFVLGSQLGLNGAIRLRDTKGALPEVHFQGNARLDGFSSAEGTAAESLLRWNSLRLYGIEASLNPAAVSVRNVTLDDVFARLIVETNRTLNLMSALRLAGTNAASVPSPTNAAPATRPKISVGSVILSNANVHFIDRSLHPNVNLNLEHLGGTLSKLSSDDAQSAAIHLQGTVNRTARAEITGKINPWNSAEPLDVRVSLQSMDLLPADPYACKYLGYRLKQGELSAQLAYQVAEGKLDSKNRLTLDQLTLGQKVESADATSLPVRLAIALLKDRDGRINLDLPISGSLHDPEFNLGAAVYHAIETALTKMVTSPFSALGALFGGKGEELSFQEFQPGSTNLSPAAIAKLDLLAKALYERPELQLQIQGSADPVTDLDALRREKMRRQMSVQERNASANHFPAAVGSGTRTAPGRTFRNPITLAKGALGLRSPVPYSSNISIKPALPDEEPVQNPSKNFADAKGATSLIRTLAPAVAAGDPDWGRERLASVVISADALPALASERALIVRAYLVQSGKVEPRRITESARDAGSKGSCVYFWLQ